MALLKSFCPTRIFSVFASAVVALAGSGLALAGEGDIYEKATAGTKVSFTASADGNPLPAFQWMKNGAAIPGATRVTLTLPSVTTADTGVYNAVATNPAGWALSNDLILTVDGSALVAAVAPSFTLQPFPSATAPRGSVFILSAAAVGTPTPTYQWRKNGVDIPGATDSTLGFASLKISDTGTYSVLASNLAGKTLSHDSMLTVVAGAHNVAPSFTLQPNPSTTAQEGSALTLSVAATGTPTPTLQWFKNGLAIPGATDSTLSFAALKTTDSATYSVLASNSAGNALSQDSVLTVVAGSQNVAPSFTQQPNPGTTTQEGSALTLSVAATGTPTPSYQWLKNGQAIPGATDSTLHFAALKTTDSATYSVLASNSAGNALSQDSVLTVVAAAIGEAPIFTLDPYSQTVGIKEYVSFKASATGTPAPAYQWYKDGVAIWGATNSWYTINPVDSSHAGTYTVVAQNDAGSATSQNAVLTVIYK